MHLAHELEKVKGGSGGLNCQITEQTCDHIPELQHCLVILSQPPENIRHNSLLYFYLPNLIQNVSSGESKLGTMWEMEFCLMYLQIS